MITFRQLVLDNEIKFKNDVAFQMKGEEGHYRKFTYSNVAEIARSIAGYLAKVGVEHGDRVALLSENRPEWPISYLGVSALGAIVVPLDVLSLPEVWLNLLADSESKVLIVSERFKDFALQAKAKLNTLKHLVIFADSNIDQFVSLKDISAEKPQVFPGSVGLSDVASIVYTSGTTGIPKGVMLSHNNIMSNVIATANLFEIGPGDQFLSVLPLHHTFETTAGFLGSFYKGACVTYAESLKSYVLIERMKETKTTIMCGVPLLYKLLYEGILRNVEEKGFLAKSLFYVLTLLSNFFKNVLGLNIGRVLFSMVHKTFGGHIRFFVSGGAAIDPEIIRGFETMGFIVLQGYGLTESAPIISACTFNLNKIGSVGRPIPGVEVKITNKNEAGMGEIIARGPNIMQGYYRRKEATDEVIKDGWLYTGDLGCVDDDGCLFITGRIKDIIVTPSGVNVYPEEVEFYLGRIPGIKEACIVGIKSEGEGLRSGTEEVFAIIVPDKEYFDKYGLENGVPIDRTFIEKAIREKIFDLNEKLPDYERIAKYQIREEELPKTSTRKVKRFLLKKQITG